MPLLFFCLVQTVNVTSKQQGPHDNEKADHYSLLSILDHAAGLEYTLFFKISVGWRQNRRFHILAGVESLYSLRVRCNSFRSRTNSAPLAISLKLSTSAWLVKAKARLNATYLGSLFSWRNFFEPSQGQVLPRLVLPDWQICCGNGWGGDRSYSPII